MAHKGMAMRNSLLLIMWNLVINSQQLSLSGIIQRGGGPESLDGVIGVTWEDTQSNRDRSAKEQLVTGLEHLGQLTRNGDNDLQRHMQNHHQKLSEKYFAVKGIFHSHKLLNRVKIRERRGDPEPSPASSEPEGTSQPEGTSEPEKNSNTTSEPKPEPEMWPEPEPDWDNAKEKWKAAWPIHVYGFATILAVLGIVSSFELVRIHVQSRRKTSLKLSLLAMILIFCWTRATALYIDPYAANATINPTVVRLLFSIGHPCLIASMSLLLLVLIDTTKMNAAPPTFQRVQIIIAVVIFHVILVLATDIVVAFFVQTKVLILICQIYYLVMGLILTIGYARVGWKIAKNSSASITRDRKMEKLRVLITVASLTGFVMVAVTIYGAAGVFGIYSDVTVVEAWPWWSFQTIGRTLEVVMVIMLLFMSVNVSGSGRGIKEFFSNCRANMFKNKVDSAEKFRVASALAYSNSWIVTVE